MDRWFTRPFMYDFIGASNQTLQGSTETQRIGAQPNHFNQPFKSDTRLISPAPISTSRP